MVSRLRKPAEVKAALAGFADGKVDVLIGTHRLLSRDVRAADLGLVIVDEEQRFGVKQKELLRQLKLKVDVLSLSATPIPRTLQMSLAGLRDISVIETPPEGRRPVRTYVGPYDEELVRRRSSARPPAKGRRSSSTTGSTPCTRSPSACGRCCPGVRFAEAHGQMDEHELEETMLRFLRGDADCLVATTIIESGLDIPQANTLIVERADQLGLAQAYQIRGRVGRSSERAFAYMLYPSEEALTPGGGPAPGDALRPHRARLGVRDRDARPRAARRRRPARRRAVGSRRGDRVRALRRAARRGGRGAAGGRRGGRRAERESPVRLDVDVDAYLPAEYVPFEAAKIDVHRRIAGARAPGELRALRDELRDRFGPLPEPVANLLELQRARIELGAAGARTAEIRGGRLSIVPLDLDAAAVGRIRERMPQAMYESRAKTLSMRVGDEPAERLAAVLELAEALAEAIRGEEQLSP